MSVAIWGTALISALMSSVPWAKSAARADYYIKDPNYMFLIEATNLPTDAVIEYYNYGTSENDNGWPNAIIISKYDLAGVSVTPIEDRISIQSVYSGTVVVDGIQYYVLRIDFDGHGDTEDWPCYGNAVMDHVKQIYASGGNGIKFQYLTDEPISYAQKPFNLNILGGDVWNFIAVEPGSWFYSIYDDHHTHHMYFLAGNEFKLLEFQDADGNGVIPHKEHYSTPIVIKDKRYHSLYLSWPVEAVCPFPTDYYKLSEMPSDEVFYTKLSHYVLEEGPFERGDVLGLLALRNLLSANSGDVNVDIDDLKAMLKGYTVAERQNPYLDDPNLDDTGHPTVSFHD